MSDCPPRRPLHSLSIIRIPFDRALEFANREKITEKLYPLFVHAISSLLYHPVNHSDSRQAADLSSGKRQAASLAAGSLPASLATHPALHSSTAQAIASRGGGATRPGLDRAHTFPTPPTSASSVLNSSSSPYDWTSSGMSAGTHAVQPLAAEIGLGSTRSMPSTPATTPSANSLHHNHSHMRAYAGQQSYDASRSLHATSAPAEHYGTQTHAHNHGYGQSSSGYMKSEMGPPLRSAGLVHDGSDLKADVYASSEQHHSSKDGSHAAQAHQYGQGGGGGYDDHDGTYGYSSIPGMQSMHGDPTASANAAHDPMGSASAGQLTPRSTADAWAGYTTPSRTSNSSINGGAVYPSQLVGGLSNKRARDDGGGGDDSAAGQEFKFTADLDAMKRRKNGGGPADYTALSHSVGVHALNRNGLR